MNLQELRKAWAESLRELLGLSEWVLGSLVETERDQGGKRRPFRYLSHSVAGRNRITYVSLAQMEPLRHSLESGKRAKELLEQISDLTVATIKAETGKRGIAQ